MPFGGDVRRDRLEIGRHDDLIADEPSGDTEEPFERVADAPSEFDDGLPF